MKKKLYKICYYFFMVVLFAIFWTLEVIGKTLFYISKVPRALGFLLMRKPYSALEEITDLSVWHSVKDIRL